MTKRRKQYEEKRNRPKASKWPTTSEKTAQGVGIVSEEHLKMFIPYEGWEPAKEKSWIEKCKENFLSKLNADVKKQYIKDFVSRSGTDER